MTNFFSKSAWIRRSVLISMLALHQPYAAWGNDINDINDTNDVNSDESLPSTENCTVEDGNGQDLSTYLDHEPPEILITSPTTDSHYTATEPEIALSGTASDDLALSVITWHCNSGCNSSGVAQGTEQWHTGNIELATGNNSLTITAIDRFGNKQNANLAIDFNTISSGYSIEVTPYPLLADTTPIPTDKITGYDLFQIGDDGEVLGLYATHTGESNNLFTDLPSGIYAARTKWDSGQTALSLPIEVGSADWQASLAAPSVDNTFDADQVPELNQCLSDYEPNKVCYMSSRAGNFEMTENGVFIEIKASGTGPDDRITLMPVPGETVKLVGNWDGLDPKTLNGFNDQRMIRVSGDWTRVYGLDLSYSHRYGIEVNAAYAHIEENHIHHLWAAAILINDPGPLGHTNGSLIQYNDVHHIANGTGIWLVYGSNDTHTADNNLIKGNLSWRNGFLQDGNMSLSHPGNADGIALFKGCDHAYDSDAGGWLDPTETGRENQCQGNKLVRNIAIWNADDCIDISSGHGTVLLGNIAANCGNKGNRGFKVYPSIAEKVTWINNIALNQNPEFNGQGSSWGFEVNVNTPDDNQQRSFGSHDFIGNVAIHNDSSDSRVNMRLESYDFGTEAENGDLFNNVSGLGGSDELVSVFTVFNEGTNHWSTIRDDGDPELVDNSYNIVDEVFTGSSIKERWYYKYNEVISRVMARRDGNLYNNGTPLPEFYQLFPADHAITPANSDSNTRSHWFESDKLNAVPDKGIGYRYMHAPYLRVSQGAANDPN